MKILSIGLGNPYYNKKVKNTSNITDKSTAKTVTNTLAVDTISFGRVAENAEKMRSMFKYGVIDIHTGQYVIDPDWFKESLQNGLFEKSIKTIVKTLKPLEDRLHPVETKLFNKIKQIATKHPLYRLDDTIQSLAPKAQIRLLRLQKPIFEELKNLSNKLPQEQKVAFDKLMYTTEQQLENKPILYSFSKKEFKYKLERIAQEIKKRSKPEEIKSISKLISMANNLPYIPSGRNYNRMLPNFDPNKSVKQANMIRQMDNYLSRSLIKGNKELINLFSDSKRQVFNIPTVVSFKIKTFTHNLQSILDTIQDKKLARDMMKIATKLPNAQEELSAFIMKSSRNSSSKIGYDMLIGSVGAIDHLKPYSHGGADSLDNYAFTTIAMNSKRGNKTIEQWLKENPATYKGSQKCADRLLELYRNGSFAKEELTPWYIIHFAQRMKKLSPEENPIILDLGTLYQELYTRRC